MRLSTIAALSAAPLALAGTIIQNSNSNPNQGIQVSVQEQGNGNDNGNGKSKSNNGKNNGNNNKASGVSEVIIIWVNQGGGAATSTVTNTVTVTDTSGVSVAAATHSVTVGGSAGLKYTPESIEAAVGDMVIFTFEAANHTATQSAFAAPCVKLAGGMDSGFIPNVNNTVVPAPQMAMQVTVATPIWFYCRQKAHCGKGMTFSINPTAEKTQAMFKQMAIAQNGTGTASPITGGTASAAAAPPAGSSAAAASTANAAAPATTSGLATGTGNVSNGQCACSCLCGMASFPNAAVQGIGAYGGMSGAMPISAISA